MDSNLYREFYRLGYWKSSFSNSSRLIDELTSMGSLENNEKYFWESKYQRSEDFRPDVYSFNNEFVNILFENNIPSMINFLTQRSLKLVHIQLRRVFPGSSYMDWHRDVHFCNDNVNGTAPAAYKLMFYPMINTENVDTQLKILPGSHNCHNFFQNKEEMLAPGLSNFDASILNAQPNRIVNVENNNSNFYFFDTSMLHAAEMSNNSKGAFRLIYLFVTEDQYNERYSQKSHHSDLFELYNSRQK